MKNSLAEHIDEYANQLEIGTVQKAYKGLTKYIMSLRTHFIKQYSTDFVIGSLYQGYMDITYFPVTPKSLTIQNLKIGIVFNHEKMRFEIWLVGRNKQIQKKYWNLLKESDWNKYPTSATPQDSIIEHVLVKKPDFGQLDSLTLRIEEETMKFIKDLEDAI